MKSKLPYGPLFDESGDMSAAKARAHLDDALRVLHKRLPENHALKKLPLTPKASEKLMKACFEFLQNYCPSAFERDNLSHVSRLVANMKIYSRDLKNYLAINYKDVQLLAALHDLGKSRVSEPIYSSLVSVFGASDFINLRVLPHEFFSFYWIQVLGREHGIEEATIQLLMDQVANHNFGPDLSLADNRPLLAKKGNGQMKHWWLEHWKRWTDKVKASGITVDSVYGHTESPLANSLVLFDRIDGGHPHSWEKFLNQDLLSGRLDFTPERIYEILEDANLTAKEQVLAVGRQLQKNFVPAKKKAPMEDFAPYADALAMLEVSEKVVRQLKNCNSIENRSQLKISAPGSILYQDRNHVWHRVDAVKLPQPHGIHYEWNHSKWKQTQSTESPVALLLETVYDDWKKAA